MRLLALMILGLLIGAAGGVASAVWVIRDSDRFGGYVVGQWSGDSTVGSGDANPYVRALVAQRGLLALPASEAMYLTLAVDDTGAPLREDCRYRIEGGPLPSQWWSITLYAADSFLAQNGDAAASVDLSRLGAGTWSADIGSSRPESGAWLSSAGAGAGYDLTLRLYRPDLSARTDPQSIPAPTLTRMECRAGEAG